MNYEATCGKRTERSNKQTLRGRNVFVSNKARNYTLVLKEKKFTLKITEIDLTTMITCQGKKLQITSIVSSLVDF